MSEPIDNEQWEELGRWAENEWRGGDCGWLSRDKDQLRLYAGLGLKLIFASHLQKETPQERYLYWIELDATMSIKLDRAYGSFGYVMAGDKKAPDTLEELLEIYIQEYAKDPKKMRRAVNRVKKAQGYQELSQVYPDILARLRQRTQHWELTSAPEEDYMESTNIARLIADDLSSISE